MVVLGFCTRRDFSKQKLELDVTASAQSSLGFDKRKEAKNRGVPREEGGTKWKVAATGMHDDVLFDTEECHE